MEIRHLKLIRAVAEKGTLTKAAEVLCLSQSALSHQLKEIESFCDGQVFNRINKKMVLTPVGERFLGMAENVLAEMEKGVLDINRMVSGEHASLRISMQCYTFYHWLTDALLEYQKSYPKTDVQIVTQAVHEVMNWLERGELDLAIVNYKPSQTNFHIEELFEDELVVLTNSEHTLANKEEISSMELNRCRYITYAMPHGQYGKAFQQVFIDNGIQPEKIIRVELTEAIIGMVRAGQGVSVLAKWAIEPYLDFPGIRVLRLTDIPLRKWYAATMPYKQVPGYISSFINIMKQLH